MHGLSILFLSVLGGFLPIAPSTALTIPYLNTLTQTNYTLPFPLHILKPHTPYHQLNLTARTTPHCHLISFPPPAPRISTTKCAFLTTEVCEDLARLGPRARGQWVWAEISGCAIGYYFPQEAILPTLATCDDLIYDRIREKCVVDGEEYFNAGSINVGALPGGGRGDGTQLEAGWGRYLMAPKELT